MSLEIRNARPAGKTTRNGLAGLAGNLAPETLIDTRLSLSDMLGALKVRWGIGRMKYRVKPGLYRVGNPGPAAPILVTANYKLTFDAVRSHLEGVDARVLVLDTKGINVWCAAGKGTFGTEELVRRIKATGLAMRTTERRLILPQLGAPGVDARAVADRCGFRVVWGPVRAEDIKAFLEAGREADARMRRVRFDLRDRIALAPIEMVQAVKYALPILGALFCLVLAGAARFDRRDLLGLSGAWLTGSLLVPILLPWIPVRPLALKGVILGLAWTILWYALNGGGASDLDVARTVAWFSLFPAAASFLALNFTGSTTYTSFSGVLAEMRIAVPLLIAAAGVGTLSLIIGGLR